MGDKKNLTSQVLKSLIAKNLLQDACAVAIIGIGDHLKRAELGLYAIELVLEELPAEDTPLFSKIKKLLRSTDGYVKMDRFDNRRDKVIVHREVVQAYSDLEELIGGEEPEVYASNNNMPPRMGLLVLAAERIASVALYSCYDDTLTLSSINAAVEYLPEEKREEVLNKIIEHGIKMLTEKN